MASYKQLFRRVGCVTVLLFVSQGCGKGEWGYLQGKVMLNGQPVGPGSLSFSPVNGDRAGAVASFGEDGQYSVISAGRKDGAPTGEYTVTVFGGESFGEESTGPVSIGKIPPKYAKAGTSNLKVTINPGSNSYDFDLKP